MRPAHLILLLSLAGTRVAAQDFGGEKTTANTAESNAREKANAALDARDYTAAVKLLQPLAEAHPKDARLAYDLASAEDALDQTSAAERSYRAAIADDPAMLEPHVALGLLLARAGRLDDAHAELTAAGKLTNGDKDLRARAFRALARLDQKAHPEQAGDELVAALKLSPETPEDTLLAAELAQSAGEPGAAEKAYRKVLAANPADADASVALAHLELQQKRPADAETTLKPALAAHLDDISLIAQMAAVLGAEGKPAEALPLLEHAHAAQPADAQLSRLLARTYLANRDYAHAEPLLTQLATQSPQDAELATDDADALIHLKRFAEAQVVLERVLAQPKVFPTPADMGNAAGALAFVYSEQNDPEKTLQALRLRATVLPSTAPILFLTAIAEDKLHHVKEARQAYQSFLAASQGAHPDQEFEARHRLIALEHTK